MTLHVGNDWFFLHNPEAVLNQQPMPLNSEIAKSSSDPEVGGMRLAILETDPLVRSWLESQALLSAVQISFASTEEELQSTVESGAVQCAVLDAASAGPRNGPGRQPLPPTAPLSNRAYY